MTRELIRRRPGMYVGGTNAAGLEHMVMEVVANAVDQHLVGHASKIALYVAADGTITLEDDGAGLPAHGEGKLPPLETILTTRVEAPTADGHAPHVHLGRGGLGLCVVNALSERFEIVTVRGGVEARAVYARGIAVEPLVTAPVQRASGTRIRFRPDRELFRYPYVARASLSRRLEDLMFLIPGAQIAWSFEHDPIAAHGLAARVAAEADCALDAVAMHRTTGAFDIEVALAWRTAREPTQIESFVNLARTHDHGSHVDGLLDGVRAFVGREPLPRMVAAVAIVSPDVRFGRPTRDQLAMPELRAPVAAVTLNALRAGADAHPEALAALGADA